ncbi:hypothetical protein ANCCAN_16164 [Ancylostoma caninum]|uniref:Uncharacterized protein n=1 Tax=Ancylostoma caninum TaxID=29170 RepID=A0A368G2L0_ANCCA|nr:hypothetical protein ANCCAN_16164 [Ancylostoma caninum]
MELFVFSQHLIPALPVEGTAGTESQLTAPSSGEGVPEGAGQAQVVPAVGPAGGPAVAGPAAAGSAAAAGAGPSQPSQGGQAGSGGVCSWRSGPADPNIPYVFSADECCDARLNTIMRDAAARSRDTPHLGDSAKVGLTSDMKNYRTSCKGRTCFP